MNDLSLYVYAKKWTIAAIVIKLILVYFKWFVHNFVNHKYNVLLNRNDVCLMPSNTFVCVCFTSIHREDWSSWNVREQINDVVLNMFLSSAKSLHRLFTIDPSHFILFTL